MTESKQLELLPCPFCGCKNISLKNMWEYIGQYIYMVGCNSCDVISGYRPTKETAIQAWNKRT